LRRSASRSVGAFGSRDIREPGPQTHARPAGGSRFDFERRLKNLFEQLSLINPRGRAHAQAFAAMKQHNLIGEFGGQSKLVCNHDHGVAIFFGQATQPLEQFDLRTDV
jgi:hypothetical protein